MDLTTDIVPSQPDRVHSRRPPVWFIWSLAALVAAGCLYVGLAKAGVLSSMIGRYETASIVIKVRDANKLPIADVIISIAGQTFKSDVNGRVELNALRSGSYDLGVSKTGYAGSSVLLALHRKGNPLEIVTLNQLPPNRFAIKGYLQDALSNQPVQNVSIKLGEETALSDPNGQFNFPNLLPGTFNLQLSGNGYAGQTLSETLGLADLVLTSLPLIPSGQIVFDTNRDGKHGIYAMGLNGAGQHRLVPAVAGEDYAPLTSPDGSHIVFQSSRDGQRDTAGNPLRRLYLVSADGSSLRSVSTDLAPTFNPLWSSDGKYLFYQGFSNPSSSQPTQRFYDLSSSNGSDLADIPKSFIFAPDGKSFAYTALGVVAGTSPAVSQLKILDLKSGIVSLVVSKPQEISDLHFSADSAAIGYQLLQGTTIQGFQTTLALHKEVSVPVRTDSKRLYILSPDGRRQAFIDQRSGAYNLFINQIDGTAERQLSSSGTADGLVAPVWDSSGKYLTFTVKAAAGPQLYGVAISGGEPYHLTEYSPN